MTESAIEELAFELQRVLTRPQSEREHPFGCISEPQILSENEVVAHAEESLG